MTTENKMVNGVEIPARRELPTEVRENMNKYRIGLMKLQDTGYIEWHINAAQLTVRTVNAMGFWISKTSMIDDGWLDGMKVYRLKVQNKTTGETKVLKWSDANQWWMEKHESGGWGYFRG